MSCEGRTTLARGVGCRTSNIPQLRFSFGRDNGTGDDRSLASSHMASRAVVGTLRRGLSRGRRAPPAAVGSSDVARDARDPFEPLGSRWRELEHVRRDWAHRRPTTSRGEESGFGAGWEVRRAFSSSSAAFTSGRDARKDIDDETSSSSSSSSSSSPVAEAGAPTGPRVNSDSSMWDVAGFLGENRRVAGICVTTALLMAGHSCVAPVLPMFAEEFGASAAQVGATLSAFALARLVLNVPFGALADSRRAQTLMVAGPLITAAGMLGSAQCEWGGLPELFFWRFVAGAGSAAYAAGAQATLADLSHRSNRARVLGANQAAVLAGAAFGPVVGGFISGAPMELGVRAPFAAVGATCALAGWHAAATAPETLRDATNFGGRNSNGTETRPKTAATEDGEAEREVAAAATGDVNVASSAGDEEGAIGASEDRGGENAETSLRETLRRRDFLAVSGLNAALFFSGAGGRATLLPLLAVQEHGYTPAGLGALFTAMAATSALGIGPGAFLVRLVWSDQSHRAVRRGIRRRRRRRRNRDRPERVPRRRHRVGVGALAHGTGARGVRDGGVAGARASRRALRVPNLRRRRFARRAGGARRARGLRRRGSRAGGERRGARGVGVGVHGGGQGRGRQDARQSVG